MNGPFKPEDLSELIEWQTGYDRAIDETATVENLNNFDARRWVCLNGGEHEPVLWELITDRGSFVDWNVTCHKCSAKITARWEAM